MYIYIYVYINIYTSSKYAAIRKSCIYIYIYIYQISMQQSISHIFISTAAVGIPLQRRDTGVLKIIDRLGTGNAITQNNFSLTVC